MPSRIILVPSLFNHKLYIIILNLVLQLLEQLEDKFSSPSGSRDLFKITKLLQLGHRCCQTDPKQRVLSCVEVEVNLAVLDDKRPIVVNGWPFYNVGKTEKDRARNEPSRKFHNHKEGPY